MSQIELHNYTVVCAGCRRAAQDFECECGNEAIRLVPPKTDMNDFEIQDSYILDDRGVVVTGVWQRAYKPEGEVRMSGFVRRIRAIERFAVAEPNDWTGQKIGLLI